MLQWAKLALAVLVPLLVVGTIWLWMYKPGPPDGARMAVSQYLVFRTGLDMVDPGIAPRYVHADRPENFTPDSNKASYGSGLYYETTYYFDQSSFALYPLTMTVGQIGYAVGADRGLRRLPERVVDAWCVQIPEPKPVLPNVVLVGAHQDLYNADWIVHEPVAQTTEELNRWLADVGCDMVITP